MSDEPEYIDLITGKPLEPWAADAMKRRATPAELPALPSREEIARLIYAEHADIEPSQFSGPTERTFEDASARGLPRAKCAGQLADAILALFPTRPLGQDIGSQAGEVDRG